MEHICSNSYQTKKSACLPWAPTIGFLLSQHETKDTIEAKTDKVAENNFLDLLEISVEFGEEDEDQLFQWVRPLHLDDEDGNPDPRIVAHV